LLFSVGLSSNLRRFDAGEIAASSTDLLMSLHGFL